jgi:predicted permease
VNEGLINQIAVFFLLAGAGYAARRLKVITGQLRLGLSALIMQVALPSAILEASQKPAEASNTAVILTVLAGGAIYYVFAIPLSAGLARLFKLEKKKGIIFVMLAVFQNVAFMGYPIISIFLPEQGVFFASFFVMLYNAVFFTYGTQRMSGKRVSLRSVLNPAVVATLLMALFYLAQIKFPAPVSGALGLLGGLSTPLSMLAIGAMLADMPIKEIFSAPILYLMAFLRLVAIPAAVFLALKALGIGGAAGTVLLVMSCLPSGNLIAIAAAREECEPELAAKGVLLSTLLFLLTVPCVAVLQQNL